LPKVQNKSNSALANPSLLGPLDRGNGKIVQVVIETPKGSRNKYAFDEQKRIFTLKRVLPAGMAFPYDFGFVPSTLADDGDPVDVLVVMDEPAFPGCLVKCRIIGIIEGEQGEKNMTNATTELWLSRTKTTAFPTSGMSATLARSFCASWKIFL
jgi:inorganic pyrophosphatase